MKRSIGKESKKSKAPQSFKTASVDGVKILLFPEGTRPSEKKEVNILAQTTIEKKKASPDSDNGRSFEEKDSSIYELEIESSLESLEESEKRLKYYIRELESFLGLS